MKPLALVGINIFGIMMSISVVLLSFFAMYHEQPVAALIEYDAGSALLTLNIVILIQNLRASR